MTPVSALHTSSLGTGVSAKAFTNICNVFLQLVGPVVSQRILRRLRRDVFTDTVIVTLDASLLGEKRLRVRERGFSVR